MSFHKKLSRAFNRTVTHGAFLASAAAMSLGIGIGVDIDAHTTWETQPPAANAQIHDAAVEKLGQDATTILVSQRKIDFTRKSLTEAQRGLRNAQDTKNLSADVNALQEADNRYEDARAQQAERLAEFRRELLLNPALSEKEADAIYEALWYKARDEGLGDIQTFFSPFSDALKMRDETVTAMKLPHDPAKVSDTQAAALVSASRDAYDATAHEALGDGALSGLEAMGGFLTLTALGALGRRRENRTPEPSPQPRPRAEEDTKNETEPRRHRPARDGFGL